MTRSEKVGEKVIFDIDYFDHIAIELKETKKQNFEFGASTMSF
jgi:hypothetical protein